MRLLVRDAAAQTNAAELFVKNCARVSQRVLAQMLWVLDAVYARTSAQIGRAIELLLNHQNPTLLDADVVALALAHFRARAMLGFSDCLVLAITRKAGHLPLGTFDKRLAKLDAAVRV